MPGHVALVVTDMEDKRQPLIPVLDESKAFAELRAQIRHEGLDKPTPVLALTIYACHIATMLGGITGFLVLEPLWLRAAALLGSTYGALGVSTSAHCASHYTATGNKTADRFLTILGFSLLLGISEAHWRHKHLRVHHTEPNNVDLDDDIDLRPWFILTQDDMANARGWWRQVYRIQHWILPFALMLNGINVQQTAVRHLVADMRTRQKISKFECADITCLLLHVAAFLVIPAFIWPLSHVAGFYLVRMMLGGYAMFAAFAPAHFPAEAIFVKSDDRELGLIARHLYTTVNFRTGPLGRLVCSGVQYQIEHHLLPNANQHRHQRVSQIVEDFCRKHGYPYRTLGWWEGIVKSVAVLRTLKPVYRASELLASERGVR
jgi:linoleoyl-CoA desaturase